MLAKTRFSTLNSRIRGVKTHDVRGSVASIGGLELMVDGLGGAVGIGSQVEISGFSGLIRGEVVALKAGIASVLPYGSWEGVSTGDEVSLLDAQGEIRPDASWLGRILDAFGNPMDGLDLGEGGRGYPYRNQPPEAFARRAVGEKLETGIKAIDIFVPLCRGQRLGIFAGSGVGKSTLMGMFARQVKEADVIVMGLVGERGRELQDFIRRDLGEDGLARSVLVVATSDQPPLTRRQAAWTATAVAEYFRDQGKHVFLMIDSVTRFAMAQREIGLAAGEPPTTKGYTPTVFAELPKLLERSGPGNPELGQGDITAIYTVLVDGDDMNEPIADTVRGILDGHAVLSRKIAEAGRYPAIDLAKSISRMLPHCHMKAENSILGEARRALSRYAEMEDIVRIGAYRQGTDPETDRALAFAPAAEAFLTQGMRDPSASEMAFATLYGLLLEGGYVIDTAGIQA
ncbi:FliI/YscN family ATPase [Paracoccus litorisediminis]|uniref:FliI/YscN family ATPase n=1 Tax=Paracoccus litorisediminis TaxID=2006130 RepID=UPI00372E43AD